MDTNVKIIGSVIDAEAELNLTSQKNAFVFSGSVSIDNTNSSYVFNFVNAETLSYILKEAKAHGEVTVEIFRHDEASKAIQQQDSTRHRL